MQYIDLRKAHEVVGAQRKTKRDCRGVYLFLHRNGARSTPCGRMEKGHRPLFKKR